ncbi:MAG: hypothetical protein IKY12_06280, partial [Clostridia bacterium]|nr:hypothetical protein [Clostridia bacterium]
KQTNESGSRVCILPENLESKKNVEYLQRLFMAVWVNSDGTTVDTVADITSGASGIITQKITDLVVAYNKYFSKNTMTRPVGIIGHQGNYVLGQPNTVAGSLNAYNLGATAIETDIHLSKDGVIIAMHDDTLDRASTGTGKISDYTYEQLKAFEVDQHGGADHEPIATLEDYFKAFDGLDVQLIVEIKTADSAVCQKLADLIRQYNIADQVNVICFDLTQLSLFKSIMPEISTGLLYNSLSAQEQKPENTVYSILELVQKYDSTYNPQYSVGPLGPEVLRTALDRGINVYPYTIDNNTELSNYFMYGAHAITTNYCHKFTDAVKSLTTDKSAYYSKTSDVPVTVNANTYARTATPVTNASLVFVDGDDIFTYADGKITANGEGRATLMFSYACKSVNNETYYVVTEPFTVAVSATDPAIALNILQDEVKDITNADGKYCQDAYAKFDAARNLNANTLSNQQALKAIADIEALTIHNSDFRYITTLNTHQKECVHCGVKQDAVSHDFENNTDELCETCEFTRYLFAVNYTDDKGMIDVSKAVLLSNETALVNAKDGEGVELSWCGKNYVFIKGTNAFTSLSAIQAKNLDNPHILVKNNT